MSRKDKLVITWLAQTARESNHVEGKIARNMVYTYAIYHRNNETIFEEYKKLSKGR